MVDKTGYSDVDAIQPEDIKEEELEFASVIYTLKFVSIVLSFGLTANNQTFKTARLSNGSWHPLTTRNV